MAPILQQNATFILLVTFGSVTSGRHRWVRPFATRFDDLQGRVAAWRVQAFIGDAIDRLEVGRRINRANMH